MKLRPYQEEAVEHALKNKRSVLVLPTGTGKTVIGFFFLKNLFDRNLIKRALVLVPTRILVEQTHKVYRKLGLDSEVIYGIFPKEKRIEMWKRAKIAISTPETVYNDIEFVKVDAVVVDECHHVVGNDAYVKVLERIECEYKLGLSAFIPKKRRGELALLIGEIREWSTRDVKPFIAEWIAEVLETPFNHAEMKVYDEIDYRRSFVRGYEKLVFTSAMKFFAKDGALALKDSLSRKNKLSKLLEDLKDDVFKLRDLHKLKFLFRVLELYDFTKSIVFVERVVVARRLVEILSKDYKVALIVGRQRDKMREMLEKAKQAELVVSTSAGEEGVDMPTADLLVNWSNTSSPLRFIQRHGRIMRKAGKSVKFVVYLVTPDTIDADDLIASIDQAKRVVDINIDRDVLEKLWRKSRKHKIVEILDEPMSIESIQRVTGRTQSEIKFALRKSIEKGELISIYTPFGKFYIRKDCIHKLDKFKEFLNPKHIGKVKVKVGGKKKTILGDYEKLRKELSKLLPLSKLEITVIKKSGEIEEYDFKSYNFPIDNLNVLDIVLKNALS